MSTSTSLPCKGCAEPNILVKSHIVPESFSVLFNRGKKPALIVGPEEYPRQSQRGIYDQSILCDDCEQKLSVPDDYAQRILIQEVSRFKQIFNGTELVAETLEPYDYKLLHRFAISVLWRASISSHYFYEYVELGPHQERLRTFSLGLEELPDDRYGIVVGKLVYKSICNMAPAPFRERIEGANYWRIYIGDWHFWIKVDSSRPTPSIFREMEAKANTPLFVLCRELLGSPEHKAAKLSADRRLR